MIWVFSSNQLTLHVFAFCVSSLNSLLLDCLRLRLHRLYYNYMGKGMLQMYATSQVHLRQGSNVASSAYS